MSADYECSTPVLSQWRHDVSNQYDADLPNGSRAVVRYHGTWASAYIYDAAGGVVGYTDMPTVELCQAFVLGYAFALRPIAQPDDYRAAEAARQAAIDAGQLTLDQYNRQPDTQHGYHNDSLGRDPIAQAELDAIDAARDAAIARADAETTAFWLRHYGVN